MQDATLLRMSTTPSILEPTFRRRCSDAVAAVDSAGSGSYADLWRQSAAVRDRLAKACPSLADERVAFLAPPGRGYATFLWGAWRAGAVAVPLATSHPLPELEYVLDDASPRLVAADPSMAQARALLKAAEARGAATLPVSAARPSPRGSHSLSQRASGPTSEPAFRLTSAREAGPAHPEPGLARGTGLEARDDGALIVYTSGATGRPKGVLSTHASLAAQVRSLVDAWAWTDQDRILHVLPLHHVHGIVNALCCALWSGAACEFGDPRPQAVWERLAEPRGITLFMAVPTVYGRLIRAWDEAPEATRRRWSRGAARLRLMVSGSAALPVTTLARWREITGHVLLERYGMTETGMILSNPLDGERRPGCVGLPLPGVEARLVDERGRPVTPGESGEVEVRGPLVFREYWGRPQETAAAFRDGWFRTGDEARLENGSYRLLGRRAVDILKTGGHRVSAIEIEEVYRTHSAVHDVAVVGVPDLEWGQRVCSAWVPADPDAAEPPSPQELRAWGKERLAPYKVPRDFRMVPGLPRNAMGKVRKPAVVSIFEGPLSTP